MEPVLSYRGRPVTADQVSQIRELMAAHPEWGRRALSLQLCARWGWYQANGYPRDMVCRGLLLALERAGQLQLPAPQPGSGPRRRVGAAAPELPLSPVAIRGSLRELGPLTFQQVRRTDQERRFNELVRVHHYLGYTQPVGEHLKFLVSAGREPVACFAWSSAPRHLGPRDRFIGWTAEARRQNIRYVAYNSRYLILPWVQVPHLASHLLGQMVRRLSSQWEQVYRHPVFLAETFVDRTRWRGTCYRAANWRCVGQTTGRGKNDQTGRANRSRKDVLVYPLHKRFRVELSRLG
jgi:hypothetical protein